MNYFDFASNILLEDLQKLIPASEYNDPLMIRTLLLLPRLKDRLAKAAKSHPELSRAALLTVENQDHFAAVTSFALLKLKMMKTASEESLLKAESRNLVALELLPL